MSGHRGNWRQPWGYRWLHIGGLALSLWLIATIYWLYGSLAQAVGTFVAQPTVTCVIAPPLPAREQQRLERALQQLDGVQAVVWPSAKLIAQGMLGWLEQQSAGAALELPYLAELTLEPGQDGPTIARMASAIPGIVAADGSAPGELAFGPMLLTARLLAGLLIAFGLFSAAALMILAVGEVMLQQQQAMAVLQLLGANWWFALRPFVVRASAMGALAGCLAGISWLGCRYAVQVALLPYLLTWLGRAVVDGIWLLPWWLLPPLGAALAGSMALLGGLRIWFELRVPTW